MFEPSAHKCLADREGSNSDIPGNPRRNKKKREPQFAPKRDLAEDVAAPNHPAQNECRIPIRTSACVCVVDGVKL